MTAGGVTKSRTGRQRGNYEFHLSFLVEHELDFLPFSLAHDVAVDFSLVAHTIERSPSALQQDMDWVPQCPASESLLVRLPASNLNQQCANLC